MQHGQVVADEEVTLLPRVPVGHAPVVQQRVERVADGGALLVVDALALDADERGLELGLALRPGLVVRQHRAAGARVVEDERQVLQLGRAEARRRHAPRQRAQVVERQVRGQVPEEARAGREEGEARVLGAGRDAREHLEPRRVGLDLLGAVGEHAARGRRLEHAVEVERHPLGAEHVVQPLRVGAAVLDLEDEAEEPRGRRAELVRLGLELGAVRRLLEAADDDGRVVLGEGADLLRVDGVDVGLAGAVGRQHHAAGVDGRGGDGRLVPRHQLAQRLVAVVARPVVLVHEVVVGVGVKVLAVARAQGAVEVERHGAVPGRREGRRDGGQRADGELVLARRLVDGQADVVGEVLAHGVGKGLAALQHLLGDVLDAALVAIVAPRLADRVDVLQVGLEELDVASIGQAGVFAVGYLLARVPVLPLVLADERRAELGRVGHVCDFGQLHVGVDVDELVQAREADLVESLLPAHGPEGLAI